MVRKGKLAKTIVTLCDVTNLTYIMTPTDQRSRDRLYPSFFSTSGAIDIIM